MTEIKYPQFKTFIDCIADSQPIRDNFEALCPKEDDIDVSAIWTITGVHIVEELPHEDMVKIFQAKVCFFLFFVFTLIKYCLFCFAFKENHPTSQEC